MAGSIAVDAVTSATNEESGDTQKNAEDVNETKLSFRKSQVTATKSTSSTSWFRSATLSLRPTRSCAVDDGDKKDKTNLKENEVCFAYFRDSSLRARLCLRAELAFPSSDSLSFLNRVVGDGGGGGGGGSVVHFECDCADPSLRVEGVAIGDTHMDAERRTVTHDLEVTLRATGAVDDPRGTRSLLNVRALLRQEVGNGVESSYGPVNNGPLDGIAVEASWRRFAPRNASTTVVTGPLAHVPVAAVHAVTVKVREVSGARAASGATLVSVEVHHNHAGHDAPVTVTNLALHPGHCFPCARPSATVVPGRGMEGGAGAVWDLSRHVRWGFSTEAPPSLPQVLQKYEAMATVLTVDASHPDSVRPTLGNTSTSSSSSSSWMAPLSVTVTVDDEQQPLVVGAVARFSTSRVMEEPSDAFRVDMSLKESRYQVGAQLVVSLKVLNLAVHDRDLMLLMAKDEEPPPPPHSTVSTTGPHAVGSQNQMGSSHEGGGAMALTGGSVRHLTGEPQPSSSHHSHAHHSVNTAVVSEVNGYTFGVWGLAGEDDGTARHIRDHELLAVDAALLLGEVKGLHSIEAELRFVPLREGTLDVPNLKLYDKIERKWYNCVHTLKIMAAPSP